MMSQSIRRCHPCDHCNKSFTSSHQLAQHNRIHTGEKPYKCSYCDKKFKQLSHVQQHTRLHTGERPYKCSVPECGRAFIQLSNLQQHMRSHCSLDKIAKNSEKKYLCTHCGKGFKGQSSLSTHQSKKHSISLSINDAIGSCPVCHLILPSSQEISLHIKKEHNSSAESQRFTRENRLTSTYTCPICGRSYQNESSYRRHLESHPEALSSPTSSTSSSSSIPLWPCSVCSSVFTTEIGLLTHMEQMRTDAKHQFEAQIILSCAAAEKRHRDAIASLNSFVTSASHSNITTTLSSSIGSLNEINRSATFNDVVNNSNLVNNSFKF